MIKRKKRKPTAQIKWPELHMQLRQQLEDTSARHAAGNHVIESLRKEVEHLRVRAETAEKHANHVVKSFEATLNMVRGSR